MREREMRQRVERFLETRLRKLLYPATLGLGLALSGCDGSSLDADDGGVAADASAQKEDAAGPTMKYLAQFPDAGPDLSTAVAEYMAPMPDSGPAVRYMAQQPRDAGPELGGVIALYLAQMPTTRS